MDCPVQTPVALITHVEDIFCGIYVGLKKKNENPVEEKYITINGREISYLKKASIL